MKERILVVDDEVSIRRALEKFLEGLGYAVSTASNGQEALEVCEKTAVDLALTDLVMPKMDGIELIRKLKSIDPQMMALVMTGFGTITSAVEAMKAGAYHYLTKPFELEDVAALVRTALEHKKLREENRELKRQLKDKFRFENIVGTSPEMHAVFDLIEKVADTDSTVLVLGESGTGKELIAKAIHYNSNRKDKSLVTVNCGAIPEDLLESELFGHMKGSFTGAIANKPGRFDVADGGTIFLDEIGDMSPKLQVKLLRVLQERKFDPVGSTATHEVDVRILAATNQDLEVAVKEGRFREDLYYRLHVIPVSIPPLRERPTDIALLAQHFVDRFNKENSHEVEGFTEEALDAMMAYEWPGNVRELENQVERLTILKRAGKIVLSDLPPKMGGRPLPKRGKKSLVDIPSSGLSFKTAVADFEEELIRQALEKAEWNKNKAAALLKLNRTTLVEKMKKRGLKVGDHYV